jgi:hypothetical protein
MFPPADAGIVAQERCLGGGDIVDSGWRVPPAPELTSADIPAYLHGRFGPRPQLITVGANDNRSFEPGCLLYSSSDATEVARSIGAVVGPAPDKAPGTLVLAARAALTTNPSLFIRDSSGPVPVTLIEKLKVEKADKA